ncbi:MAG: hypothetical protein Q9M31_06000 [Mariprofundus sp.]|nr:hypothetical protein [Mariprofundus sp.]
MNHSADQPVMINKEAAMDVVHQQWAPTWLRGVTAFFVGGALIQTALELLGVHLEWFVGMATFNANWLVAMTLMPVFVGIVIGMIYGFGGKYLAHFPPLTVLLISYYQSTHGVLPEGVELLPWGLWVMFMILQMEFCAVGGFIGEILVRRRTGWLHRYGAAPDADPLPDDGEQVGQSRG